jgi:hypothetical protein
MYEGLQLSLEQYSRLEKLHLHLNLPEKAVICTRCGYALAVDDDRVGHTWATCSVILLLVLYNMLIFFYSVILLSCYGSYTNLL